MVMPTGHPTIMSLQLPFEHLHT